MRRHTNWIDSYLEAVVPRSEAPERFHYWVAAAVVAGALRRRVYIDMEAFRWYPNMYLVLVGPPGTVKKSTTINIGARLLRDVPGIHFGSDITTWESFIQEVEDAKDMFAEGGSAFGTGHNSNRFSFDAEHQITSALTCTISEWGTFLDPNNHQMVNMMTELYDGRDIPLRKTTKTQGSNTITSPFINMIAGTTPDWMASNFKGRFGGWGFSSRCIFLHCDAPEKIIPYPDEEWRGSFGTSMRSLLGDLKEISHLNGRLTLTPAARGYGRQWYAHHMQRKTEIDKHPNHDPWLSYYLARKFDHAHKLAITVSAARADSDLTVTEGDLTTACKRCDEVELELSRVFGTEQRNVGRTAKLNQDVWEALANMITKNNGGIPERAAYQFTLRYMGYGETKQFLDHLCASELLQKEVDQGQTWLVFGPQHRVPAAQPQ